ncbi:MAG: SDR family oxidoreductase, partial [Pseudomonadota bacterium]
MADPTPPGPTDDGNSDAQSLDFMGRVALVTGASRGIGRATVHALADRGAHVVAVARRVAALEELDDELRAKGREITLLQVDLKRGDKIDAIGPSLYQRWGKLDVLASCAGVLGPLSPLNHTQAAVWNECMTVN